MFTSFLAFVVVLSGASIGAQGRVSVPPGFGFRVLGVLGLRVLG